MILHPPRLPKGPSWSTLEYDGTPKLAHHVMRRVFADLLISGRLQSASSSSSTAAKLDVLEVVLTSDKLTSVSGLVRIEVTRWDGSQSVIVSEQSALGPAAGSTVIWRGSVSEALAAARCEASSLSWLGGHVHSTRCYIRLQFTPEVSLD